MEIKLQHVDASNTVRGSNSSGVDFDTIWEGPRGSNRLLYDGYRVFPGGKLAGAWR